MWDFLSLELKHLIETLTLEQAGVRTYGVIKKFEFSVTA